MVAFVTVEARIPVRVLPLAVPSGYTPMVLPWTMLPVVPDYQRYRTGRDERETRGELGLHGHWVKLMLHYLFLYKAKARPGWQFIPE